MPDNPNSRDKAQEFLQNEIAKLQGQAAAREKDYKALINEYVTASDKDGPEKAKKSVRARVPQAWEVIDELLQTGGDSIRSGLARWVIDRALTPDSLGGDSIADKEFRQLLKALAKND